MNVGRHLCTIESVAIVKDVELISSSCLTPKIPQNPKWVAGTLGRLPELEFLLFFDAFFMVDSINHKLQGVENFIKF
jgi:hypothetical protein